MPSLPDPMKTARTGAGAAATVLETTAGVLREFADQAEQAEQAGPEQAASPEEHRHAVKPMPRARCKKPPAATRQRIADPKAAKKVRAREQ